MGRVHGFIEAEGMLHHDDERHDTEDTAEL